MFFLLPQKISPPFGRRFLPKYTVFRWIFTIKSSFSLVSPPQARTFYPFCCFLLKIPSIFLWFWQNIFENIFDLAERIFRNRNNFENCFDFFENKKHWHRYFENWDLSEINAVTADALRLHSHKETNLFEFFMERHVKMFAKFARPAPVLPF